MSIPTPHVPHPAPRDIAGNEAATLVRCPDCSAAVFNLRHQRQAHLKWHDDLDADVASAQENAHAAVTAAEQAQRALGDARREIAELRRELAEATGSPNPVAPLVADWPEDEIAARAAARAATHTDDDATAGEPEPDLDPAATPDDDLDDGDYVEIPARRF